MITMVVYFLFVRIRLCSNRIRVARAVFLLLAFQIAGIFGAMTSISEMPSGISLYFEQRFLWQIALFLTGFFAVILTRLPTHLKLITSNIPFRLSSVLVLAFCLLCGVQATRAFHGGVSGCWTGIGLRVL